MNEPESYDNRLLSFVVVCNRKLEDRGWKREARNSQQNLVMLFQTSNRQPQTSTAQIVMFSFPRELTNPNSIPYLRIMPEKKCLECGIPFKGRTDKKFCSDQCRSSHNNVLNSDVSNYVRNVNNALRKNRRILDSMNPGGKIKVAASRLKEEGFDFRYHTTTYTTRDGVIYYYCYEQGYLPIEKNYFLLVVKQDFQG